MALRTDISKKHLLRLSAVATVCMGFALWALYDGAHAWPNQRKQALKYQELKQEERLREWPLVVAENGWNFFDNEEPVKAYLELKEQGHLDEFPQLVVEQGWKVYKPNPETPRTESEIAVQFYMVGLAGGAGLLVLIHVLRCIGRWIEMDDAGLSSSRGHRIEFDQITKIDKKKWDKKGIAKLLYQDDGREKKFTLDDFIYERPTTDEILRQVEERVGHDKIVNGKPEPPPKEASPEVDPAPTAS
ncbi:MAG: hypothetical protein MI725_11990 [Pirellulales bacterium]|nr:hypothetical protein [Pirellulales bacterium]